MEPWQSSKDRMKHSMGLRQPVRVLLIDASIFVLHALRVVTTRVQRIYERLRLSRRSEAARYFAQGEKGSTH